MALRIANTFADRLNPRWGVPTLKPAIGESFDANNDLVLIAPDAVMHRDGHITRGSAISVIYDALIDYNRRNMGAADFAAYYADDPSESYL